MRRIVVRRNYGYNEKRNFVSLFNNYFRTRDLVPFGAIIKFKLTREGYSAFWQGLFLNPFNKHPLHSFNTIPLDSRKFIVHFETTIPRIGLNAGGLIERKLIKNLSKPTCIKLIALSKAALSLETAFLKNNYPNYADTILNKTIVIHPPQKVNYDLHRVSKTKNEPVVFGFIGRDFARKGGFEIIEAFSKLSNLDWKLKIISDFNIKDYATQYSNSELKKKQILLDSFIKANSHRIEVFSNLKNNHVLKIISECDVGLLPTWADSYGYSCLEFQASGCPVISTDIRSLPEINNNDCGWVIHVSKSDNNLDGKLLTKNNRIDFSKHLGENLTTILKKLIENPKCNQIICEKAQASIARVKKYHNSKINLELLTPLVKKLY